MAALQCSRCMAERKGFRRELDSWRYRLIHCVGFETILESICGPMLLKDLNLFVDCEPDEVDDWSAEGSLSHCSFCNLLLDNDQVPAAVSPLSSPSDYSPCQTSTVSESSLSAHKFLQAVFHKKDVSRDCDPKIPWAAQELMKKMIRQFAKEYASKCQPPISTNGVTRPSSPLSETSDAPLDLRVKGTVEERESAPESETDGVLDLSNRNSATSSSNDKASGSRLPSVTEEEGVVGQRGTKFQQRSAWDDILHSLCKAHRSLLCQILKLAHQENLLSFLNHKPVGHMECHCCHSGVNPQIDVEPLSIPMKECKAHPNKSCYPSGDCNHLVNSDSNCSLNHYHLKDSNSESQQGSSHDCVLRCRGETCPSLCSNSSSPLLSHSSACILSPTLCSSVCHKQHQSCSCSCYKTHLCQTPVRTRAEAGSGDGDSPCTGLSRERSPSPPRLSPIPQAISKKIYEKPPSLSYHTQGEEADLIVKDSWTARHMTTGVDSDTEPQCEDIVRRVTSKFEEITSYQNSTLIPTAVCVSKEQSQVPSSSQPLHDDDHLTEIITTVLHTGSASDYSLSELFNRHHEKEPKLPNTRSRRRQQIQVAIATPADDACARRNTLAIKRKIAILDLSYSQRKGTPAKKVRRSKPNVSVPTSINSSVPELIKEACQRTEVRVELVKNLGANEGISCSFSTERDRDKPKKDIKAVTVTDELQTVNKEIEDVMCFDKGGLTVSNTEHVQEPLNTCGKKFLIGDNVQTQAVCMTPTSTGCTESCDWSHEETTLFQNDGTDRTTDKHVHSPLNEEHNCMSHQSRGVRKSLRNIVPPQRFASYFKWHPISHPSSVETENTQAKLDSTTPLYPQEHKGTFEPKPKELPEPTCTQSEDECHVLPQTMAIKKGSSPINSSEKETDSSNSLAYGRLRSSTRRLKGLNMSQNMLNISSPIKLMYVYTVKDDEGVKYSLKSAGSGSSLQTEEAFDPCVESSWAGTPQKHKNQSKEHAVSPAKKSPSPAKAVTSRASSTSSPAKSPKCRSSPRSATSSPKSSAKTSDCTPSKRLSETENQRSPHDLVSICETTPLKRRPGRPRKLGPQLEQKVKRPIGRPRKQKNSDAVPDSKSLNGKCSNTDAEEDITKNLKITIVYGRSRRNKRVVSESFDQLQSDFNNACQAANLKSDLGFSLHCSRRSSGIIKSSQKDFFSLTKEPTSQFSSRIKSRRPVDPAPSRKPGRPAKIKISGISVTVTAASPLRRQIQINRDTRISPKAKALKKAPLPESAQEPCISTTQLPIKSSPTEVIETKQRNKYDLPNQAIALRHSKRERKPSVHFLHAVATSTSRSYKYSHALLRRSKQLLINKASNERRQEEQQAGAETQPLKRQPCRKERENITQDLSKVAKVSLESIFSPRETVRWWAASAKEKTMDQELARRIKTMSDTWVADAANDQVKEGIHNPDLEMTGNNTGTRKSKKSSVVRTLFDCSPNKPRSCSMEQICSWFMQTTETQSLAIVKKASSRNPFEIMHFPRSANKTSVRHSPQAERLRKHIKKFAKIVPKSPLQHQQARLRLRKKKKSHQIRRQLFVSRHAVGKRNRRIMWWRFSLSAQFRATLFRVRRRFLTLRERERWQRWKSNKKNKRDMASANRPIANVLQQNHHKALYRSEKHQLSVSLRKSSPTCSVDQTPTHAYVHKDHKLSSKAWSPEKLKECRVFLRKINSPDNESTEEGDSCTVTLDNSSPSTDLFEEKEDDLDVVAKAVRNERKRSLNKRICSRRLSNSAPESTLKVKQRGKCKQKEVASPEIQPPAKVLRQSRMRGLTGPRWCDFVFET